MRPAVIVIVCLLATSAQAQQTSMELGFSLVMGNGEIISGQPAGDETAAALRVFRPSDGGWRLAATHVVDGIGPDDEFASVMVLDGNLLVAGAEGKDDGRGAVYLFMRDDETGDWHHMDMLAVEDSSALLGKALDLRGNMLLAGAPGINTVLVVQGVGTEAQTITRLAAEGLAPGDRFGEAVAHDGERIFVGAPGQDSLAGAVYVFRPTESGFEQEAMLQAAGHKGFGKTLAALAPGPVLAPAPGLTMRERFSMGERRVSFSRRDSSFPIFELRIDEAGTWQQVIAIDSLFDFSVQASDHGIPLAVSSNRLLVGLSGNYGDVQIYTRQTAPSGWFLHSEIESLENEDGLGSAVAMDGNQVAILADGANYDHGAIVAFAMMDSGAERIGRMTLVQEIALTRSGRVDCTEGAALHFGCSNIDLLAFMPISDLGGEPGISLNDVWGWTDQETGVEYALVGREDGTAFVDISNPSAPVLIRRPAPNRRGLSEHMAGHKGL